MKFSDLQALVAELVALQCPAGAVVQVQLNNEANPSSVVNLQAAAFTLLGQNASYSINNANAWAPVVSQAPAVILTM